ncbi:hypothetical protein IF2G_06791 [Cordyceps javanica]|nr:hypothetical protein IF2G_06791 [Cordyceps javanica]
MEGRGDIIGGTHLRVSVSSATQHRGERERNVTSYGGTLPKVCMCNVSALFLFSYSKPVQFLYHSICVSKRHSAALMYIQQSKSRKGQYTDCTIKSSKSQCSQMGEKRADDALGCGVAWRTSPQGTIDQPNMEKLRRKGEKKEHQEQTLGLRDSRHK